MIEDYFERVNRAADAGPPTQQRVFRDTQHPDFRGATCSLDEMALRIDPAVPSIQTDPDWVPTGAPGPPRGTVYLVPVRVTVLTSPGADVPPGSGAVVGEQIGSQHVVVLDGSAFGFAPCPV